MVKRWSVGKVSNLVHITAHDHYILHGLTKPILCIVLEKGVAPCGTFSSLLQIAKHWKHCRTSHEIIVKNVSKSPFLQCDLLLSHSTDLNWLNFNVLPATLITHVCNLRVLPNSMNSYGLIGCHKPPNKSRRSKSIFGVQPFPTALGCRNALCRLMSFISCLSKTSLLFQVRDSLFTYLSHLFSMPMISTSDQT